MLPDRDALRRHGTATVIGVYRDPQLLQGTIVPQDLFDRVSAARDPWMIFAATRDGVDADTAKKHLAAALADIPTAAVESQADYADAISGQLDQFVYLLYALLAMSVVISLFGIANSLFLSIHERTREFGLLRAVGATKAQVRQMVRYESVITAVIGGLLGTAIGILFALLVTSSLDDLGLGFDPPLRQLAIFLLLAVAVGVIAAVVPPRRGVADAGRRRATGRVVKRSATRAWLAAWPGGALIGVANGVLREATYGKRVGEQPAHRISGITAIAAFGLYFAALQRRWPLASTRESRRGRRGVAFSNRRFRVRIRSCSCQAVLGGTTADYNVARGRTWPFVLAAIAGGPAVLRKLRPGP